VEVVGFNPARKNGGRDSNPPFYRAVVAKSNADIRVNIFKDPTTPTETTSARA